MTREIGQPGKTVPSTPTTKDAFQPLPRTARDMEQAEQADSGIDEARFPLAARRARENAARERAVRRAQARSLFSRTHAPGTPLPEELQEGGAA